MQDANGCLSFLFMYCLSSQTLLNIILYLANMIVQFTVDTKTVAKQDFFFQFQFLVQSIFETLHYCDEWRKFTSGSQAVSQSVIES